MIKKNFFHFFASWLQWHTLKVLLTLELIVRLGTVGENKVEPILVVHLEYLSQEVFI
jgi:hypothetical protein